MADRLGIPTVSHSVARPGESRYHGPNKRVRVRDLLDRTRMICRAALFGGTVTTTVTPRATARADDLRRAGIVCNGLDCTPIANADTADGRGNRHVPG